MFKFLLLFVIVVGSSHSALAKSPSKAGIKRSLKTHVLALLAGGAIVAGEAPSFAQPQSAAPSSERKASAPARKSTPRIFIQGRSRRAVERQTPDPAKGYYTAPDKHGEVHFIYKPREHGNGHPLG